MSTRRIPPLRRMLATGAAIALLALSGCVAYPYPGYGYYGGGYGGYYGAPYAYGYAGPPVVVGGVWGGGGWRGGGGYYGGGGWGGRYWR